MPSFPEVREYASALYDPESRPKTVANALVGLGAERVLERVGLVKNANDIIETVASMTTLTGLTQKKTELSELAAPYIAKARSGADGRKELAEELAATQIVQDGRVILDERVLKPIEAKLNAGKEFAAPYVSSVKETSAPYVAKLEEIRRSERVEAMVSAFHDARAHPAEKAVELKEKAIDLIKYENLRAYREHVMSAEFQADTLQLVKVDLPHIATSAAKRGADQLKTTATSLAAEVDTLREKASTMYNEKVPTQAEAKAALESLREKLKATGASLAAELQVELTEGVEQIKTEGFSVNETLERLKRVIAVVDKLVVTPLISSVKAGEAGAAATETAAETAEVEAVADEPMDDAEIDGIPTRALNTRSSPPCAPFAPPPGSTTDEEEMKDAMEEAEAY